MIPREGEPGRRIRYTVESQLTLASADFVALVNRHRLIGVVHLLRGLLETKGTFAEHLLTDLGVNPSRLEEVISGLQVEKNSKVARRDPIRSEYTQEAQYAVDLAEGLAGARRDEVTTEDLLLALSRNPNSLN